MALAAAKVDDGSGNGQSLSSVSSGWTSGPNAVPAWHSTFTAKRNSLTADTTTAITCTFSFLRRLGSGCGNDHLDCSLSIRRRKRAADAGAARLRLMKPPLRIPRDQVAEVVRSIQSLAKKEVLIGIPEATSSRPDEEITNAELGYIHENGSPANNIPARPFLIPGVQKAQEGAAKIMKEGAQETLSSGKAIDEALDRAGVLASNSVKRMFTDNDWPARSAGHDRPQGQRPAADRYRRAQTIRHARGGEKVNAIFGCNARPREPGVCGPEPYGDALYADRRLERPGGRYAGDDGIFRCSCYGGPRLFS